MTVFIFWHFIIFGTYKCTLKKKTTKKDKMYLKKKKKVKHDRFHCIHFLLTEYF